MRQLCLLLLVFMPFGNIQAEPEQGPQPVVVAMGNFEPYFLASSQSGIFTDIVTAVFERMPGYEPHYLFGLSNNQLGSAFAGGRADAVANVFDTVELEGCRSDPVFRFRDVAITLFSEDLDIQSVIDLKGRSIVSFEGAYDFFGPSFSSVVEKAHYKEVEKPHLQARLLMAGRYQVSVGDLMIFLQARQSIAQKEGRDALPAIVVHDIFPQKYSRMAFKEQAVCTAFNEALAQLKASGEYEAIYTRYQTTLQ